MDGGRCVAIAVGGSTGADTVSSHAARDSFSPADEIDSNEGSVLCIFFLFWPPPGLVWCLSPHFGQYQSSNASASSCVTFMQSPWNLCNRVISASARMTRVKASITIRHTWSNQSKIDHRPSDLLNALCTRTTASRSSTVALADVLPNRAMVPPSSRPTISRQSEVLRGWSASLP
jgi:hypothetical protein